MELFPSHAIQVLNLFWFPMVYGVLSLIVMMKINQKAKKRILTFPKYKSKSNKFFSIVFMLIFGKLIIIYTFFVPIIFFTVYFYIGIVIFSLGIISSVYAMWTFSKADLLKPVTTGIYKYSRHPMQVMYYISWIGLGFISSSWIFVIYSFVFMLLAIPSLIAQENDCLERYGEEYLKYIKKTPRFLFFK